MFISTFKKASYKIMHLIVLHAAKITPLSTIYLALKVFLLDNTKFLKD